MRYLILALIMMTNSYARETSCTIDTRPADECLYGTWDVDISTVKAFYQRMLSSTGATLRIVEFSGAMVVTFGRDGQGIMENSNLKSVMEMRSGSSNITVINEIWGNTLWKYTTKGIGNICSEDIENNLQGKGTVIVAGTSRTVPLDPRMFDGSSFGRKFTYECEGNRLLYKTAIGVGPGNTDMEFNYLFRRRE